MWVVLQQELMSAREIKFPGPKSNGLWTSMQPLILKQKTSFPEQKFWYRQWPASGGPDVGHDLTQASQASSKENLSWNKNFDTDSD